MPYVKKHFREFVDSDLNKIAYTIQEPGQLCYCIFRLMFIVVKRLGWKFEIMSRAISELECAKLEFYRRYVGPYEDTKIEENGDVEL